MNQLKYFNILLILDYNNFEIDYVSVLIDLDHSNIFSHFFITFCKLFKVIFEQLSYETSTLHAFNMIMFCRMRKEYQKKKDCYQACSFYSELKSRREEILNGQ